MPESLDKEMNRLSLLRTMDPEPGLEGIQALQVGNHLDGHQTRCLTALAILTWPTTKPPMSTVRIGRRYWMGSVNYSEGPKIVFANLMSDLRAERQLQPKLR